VRWHIDLVIAAQDPFASGVANGPFKTHIAGMAKLLLARFNSDRESALRERQHRCHWVQSILSRRFLAQ
jgi:hypothetical protein